MEHIIKNKQSQLLSKLKRHEGQVVEYLYRGKYRKMLMVAVQSEPGLIKGIYQVDVGYVRLDYIDKDVVREWWGYWTKHIDKIRLIPN
jgi:hypothetical protein